MTAKLTTRVLHQDEYPAWVATVIASPDGSIYSLPDYLEALCVVAGGRFRVLVAERDGHISGGIALYERSKRHGVFVSQRPMLYYNGIVLAAHDSKYPGHVTTLNVETMRALEHALTQLGYAHIRFKSRSTSTDMRVFQSQGWSVQPTYTYVVNIGDLSAAWERVDKNQRRLIGRCTEQGLRVTIDYDFETFYHLQMENHERKGARLHLPRDEFRRLIETLRAKDLCRLYHARLPDGRAAATQLVLTGPHPVSHTVCAAAEGELLSLGASPFLRWKVFEDLANAGYIANDLTDAELNPVTTFKCQLGGDLSLCLEVTRPDYLAWRLGEFAASTPQLAKRVMRHALHISPRGFR